MALICISKRFDPARNSWFDLEEFLSYCQAAYGSWPELQVHYPTPGVLLYLHGCEVILVQVADND